MNNTVATREPAYTAAHSHKETRKSSEKKHGFSLIPHATARGEGIFSPLSFSQRGCLAALISVIGYDRIISFDLRWMADKIKSNEGTLSRILHSFEEMEEPVIYSKLLKRTVKGKETGRPVWHVMIPSKKFWEENDRFYPAPTDDVPFFKSDADADCNDTDADCNENGSDRCKIADKVISSTSNTSPVRKSNVVAEQEEIETTTNTSLSSQEKINEEMKTAGREKIYQDIANVLELPLSAQLTRVIEYYYPLLGEIALKLSAKDAIKYIKDNNGKMTPAFFKTTCANWVKYGFAEKQKTPPDQIEDIQASPFLSQPTSSCAPSLSSSSSSPRPKRDTRALTEKMKKLEELFPEFRFKTSLESLNASFDELDRYDEDYQWRMNATDYYLETGYLATSAEEIEKILVEQAS